MHYKFSTDLSHDLEIISKFFFDFFEIFYLVYVLFIVVTEHQIHRKV